MADECSLDFFVPEVIELVRGQFDKVYLEELRFIKHKEGQEPNVF